MLRRPKEQEYVGIDAELTALRKMIGTIAGADAIVGGKYIAY